MRCKGMRATCWFRNFPVPSTASILAYSPMVPCQTIERKVVNVMAIPAVICCTMMHTRRRTRRWSSGTSHLSCVSRVGADLSPIASSGRGRWCPEGLVLLFMVCATVFRPIHCAATPWSGLACLYTDWPLGPGLVRPPAAMVGVLRLDVRSLLSGPLGFVWFNLGVRRSPPGPCWIARVRCHRPHLGSVPLGCC